MKQTSRTTTSRRSRIAGRLGLAVASAGLVFGLSACGFGAQTLQPYTPADGVNVDVSVGRDGKPTAGTVKVRNLMVLAKSPTSGYLSATVVSQQADQLTGVSGTLLTADGKPGPKLTVDLAAPVKLTPGHGVVLTDGQAITLKASDLRPGLLADLTLTFQRAGSQRVQVPIVDGYNETYKTVEPTPAPSGSPTPKA